MPSDNLQPPWRWFAWQVLARDDRGVVVRVRAVPGLFRPIIGKPPHMNAAGRAIALERPVFSGICGALTGLLVFPFVPISFSLRGSLPLGVAFVVCFFSSFGLAWLFQRFTALRWTAERALVDSRGHFLKPGACLACGYRIADLAPESDGCRVCPECGAAWDMAPRPAPVIAPAPSPPTAPELLRLLAWTPSLVDAAGVRRRARWIKERWLWGAALPPAVRSAPGAAAWRRAGLAMTGILAAGSILMAYAVAFEKLGLGPEGEFRREAGLVLLGIILLLRLSVVRAAAERTLAVLARQLTAADACLACGVPLAKGRRLAPARVQCITCGGQWHVPEAAAQSTSAADDVARLPHSRNRAAARL